MDFLLDRPGIIALALLGGGLSLAASVLQMRGMASEATARRLNYAGYALMGASMALFVWVGLRGGAPG